MSQTSPAADTRSPLEALLPHSALLAYGLIVAGAAMAIVPLLNIFRHEHDNPPLIIWGAAVALTLIVAGVIYLVMPRGRKISEDVDNLRMLILAVLGVIGFVTALFGLALPLVQYRDQLAGGLEDWRKNAKLLTWCVLAFVGGLVLMFVGLTMGRAYERSQVGLRRLVYGYNAVLTSLLLLLVLVIVNVLCYSPVPPFSKFRAPIDWTSAGIYTLQPTTKTLVASIEQPVKIYLLMPSTLRIGDLSLSDQMIGLMQNIRAVNERISWETVSPQLNEERYDELSKKYQLSEYSVLVVFGTEPGAQTETIPLADLYKVDRGEAMSDKGPKVQFTGESALYKTLTYLSEGKKKTRVYFTQGNGELDFNDRTPKQKRDEGIGLLIDELSKGNYDLQPLPFDSKTLLEKKGIPDDADVVVIAGPRMTLSPDAIGALQTYMHKPHGAENKPGKLIVMLEVVTTETGTMLQTGLEPMLREFGVNPGNNHVLSVTEQPNTVPGIANPRSAIGRSFTNETTITTFLFSGARTVGPAPPAPGQDTSYSVEELIVTHPEIPVWAEEDLKLAAAPVPLLKDLLGNKDKQREKLKVRLPLAVTVTETKGAMLPPGHPGASKEQTPRMIVFGDSTWTSNALVGARPDDIDLFRNCLVWLRERPNYGTPPASKENPTYSIATTEQAATRLKWLPTGLMVIGVVALGTGVWLVRRR